jgi:hypothetical protein
MQRVVLSVDKLFPTGEALLDEVYFECLAAFKGESLVSTAGRLWDEAESSTRV